MADEDVTLSADDMATSAVYIRSMYDPTRKNVCKNQGRVQDFSQGRGGSTMWAQYSRL